MNTYAEDIRMRFDVSHWMLNDMLKVNLNMVKKWHKNSATNATATDQSNIYRQQLHVIRQLRFITKMVLIMKISG